MRSSIFADTLFINGVASLAIFLPATLLIKASIRLLLDEDILLREDDLNADDFVGDLADDFVGDLTDDFVGTAQA